MDEFLQGNINGTNYKACNICDLTRQLRNFTLECAKMSLQLNQSLSRCNDDNDYLRDVVNSRYSFSFAPSSSYSGHRVNRHSSANDDSPTRRENAEARALSQVEFEKKLQKVLVKDYEKNFHHNIEHHLDTYENGTSFDSDGDE